MGAGSSSQSPPLPVDLGLPDKFAKFNSGQFEMAMALAISEKRASMLSAPTGAGKSLIYMTVAKLLDARTLVITGTKGLQTQLIKDFSSAGMLDVRGQANYACLALSPGGPLVSVGRVGANCNEGPCKVGVHCGLREDGCLYYDAQRAASEASMVVTNYAYWLTLGQHSDPYAIGDFDLLILDEAHTAREWLTDFCAVELDKTEVKELTGLDLPSIEEGTRLWAEWAKTALKVTSERSIVVRASLPGAGRDATEELLQLSDLARGLSTLNDSRRWKNAEGAKKDARMPGLRSDWVGEDTKRGVKFSPIWTHAYGEGALFRGVKKVLLVSATLTPEVGKYLGLDPKDTDYYEMASTFDPKRRPFIYVPTTRVDRSMVEGQVRIWLNRIDSIIDGRLDRKGIIHARSYARAQEIVKRSRHRGIMLTHSSWDTAKVVAQFKRAKAPCVLVSPSVEEGFDFPMEECRYQIIAKVPFVDSRSPVMKARAKADKGHLNYLAALSLVQMVGRGMRSAQDMCESFILDDHWAWFRAAAQFPRWFKAAWVQRDSIPPALPLPPVGGR